MPYQNICKFPAPSFSELLSIVCFVLETDPRNMARDHRLNAHRVILVTQGRVIVHTNDEAYPIEKGALLFAFEGESVVTKGEEDSAYLYIDFSGPRADDLLRRFEISDSHRLFDGFENLIPLWTEALSRSSTQTIDLAAEGVLLHAFSRFSMESSPKNDLISRIVKISDERFQDSTLSISSLAYELSYSSKYLSHLFRQKMGMTYSEYLRTLRIRYAVSLFDHGIDSIKNVALLSGFTDPLYFSGVFKKQFGVSPTEYIRSREKGKE